MLIFVLILKKLYLIIKIFNVWEFGVGLAKASPRKAAGTRHNKKRIRRVFLKKFLLKEWFYNKKRFKEQSAELENFLEAENTEKEKQINNLLKKIETLEKNNENIIKKHENDAKEILTLTKNIENLKVLIVFALFFLKIIEKSRAKLRVLSRNEEKNHWSRRNKRRFEE